MKVNYKGKLERLDEASQRKLDARYQKLGKLLDRKSEKEAHVILTSERHLRNAEITVNYYDHALVGVHAAKDNLEALLGACDKLEKQILKHQTKRRDTKRRATDTVRKAAPATPAVAAADVAEEAAAPRIYRVNHKASRKPMTVEEALLEFTDRKKYVVFQDSDTEKVSVLLRRPDGHFDLIES
ncbi:MAG: sigma 54 modulation/S30EA ribosomal C-terminal domain-containing protein [Bryobacterales bacterium]|nr:sigma 54 modulation/S30EA ribosomal C-terminal domain-containing protein [Bryobacterales bacterium]